MEKMNSIMKSFHEGIEKVDGMQVVRFEDYSKGLNGLPKSDVLKFFFDGRNEFSAVVIRPSGINLMLKACVSIRASD